MPYDLNNPPVPRKKPKDTSPYDLSSRNFPKKKEPKTSINPYDLSSYTHKYPRK